MGTLRSNALNGVHTASCDKLFDLNIPRMQQAGLAGQFALRLCMLLGICARFVYANREDWFRSCSLLPTDVR
jgi:hypothetical protein